MNLGKENLALAKEKTCLKIELVLMQQEIQRGREPKLAHEM